MSITFSQKILCGKLLLAVISRQQSNFSCKFKFKTCNNLPTEIYCENIVDITPLIKAWAKDTNY